MRKIIRIGTLGSLIAASLAASAQVTYSNVVANVAFTPSGSATINWSTQGQANQIIDFLTGQVPVIVGDSTTHTSAIVNVIYEATSPAPMSAVGMVIQGSVFDWGRITWSEIIEDLNNQSVVIGQAQGQFLGASYTGGQNGAINFSNLINFSDSSTHIKVKKTFTLDIDGQTLPTTSLASLGLVEQNIVPEPATLVVGTASLVAMVFRRRKR